MSAPRPPQFTAQPLAFPSKQDLLTTAYNLLRQGRYQEAISIYQPFAAVGDVYAQTMLQHIAALQAKQAAIPAPIASAPASPPIPPAHLKAWEEEIKQTLSKLPYLLKEVAQLCKQPSTAPIYRVSHEQLQSVYGAAIESMRQGNINVIGAACSRLQQELSVENKDLVEKLKKIAADCFTKSNLVKKHHTLETIAINMCKEMIADIPPLSPPAAVKTKRMVTASPPPQSSSALIKTRMSPESHLMATNAANSTYGIKSEKTNGLIKMGYGKTFPIGKDIIPNSYPHHQVTSELLKQHLPELLKVATQLQQGGWKVYLVGSTVNRLLKVARSVAVKKTDSLSIKFSDIDLVISPDRTDPKPVPLKTLFPTGQEAPTHAKVFEYSVGDKKFDISRFQKYTPSSEIEDNAIPSFDTEKMEDDFARRDICYSPYLDLKNLDLIAFYVDRSPEEPLEDILLRVNKACGLTADLRWINDSSERLEADPRIIERLLFKLMTADYTLHVKTEACLFDNACWLAKLGLRFSIQKSTRYWEYLKSPDRTLNDLERMHRVWEKYKEAFGFLFSSDIPGSLNHAETFAEALQKTLAAAKTQPVAAAVPEVTKKELSLSTSPATTVSTSTTMHATTAKDQLVRMHRPTELAHLNKTFDDSRNILLEMAKLYKKEQQTFDVNYEYIDYSYYTAVKYHTDLPYKEKEDETAKEKKEARKRENAGLELNEAKAIHWHNLGDTFNRLQVQMAESDLQLQKSDKQTHKAFRMNLSRIAQCCYRAEEAVKRFPTLARETFTRDPNTPKPDVHLVLQINSVADIEMVLNKLEKSLEKISSLAKKHILLSTRSASGNHLGRISEEYNNVIRHLQLGNWTELGNHCRHLQMQVKLDRNTIFAKNTLSRIQEWTNSISAVMEKNPSLAKEAKDLVSLKPHSDTIAKLAAAAKYIVTPKPNSANIAATSTTTPRRPSAHHVARYRRRH